MPTTDIPNDEAAILGRVVEPDKPTLTADAARALLGLGFGPADRERMDALAAKSRAGELTAGERGEVEAYSRIGSLLGVLKSKARRSLRHGQG